MPIMLPMPISHESVVCGIFCASPPNWFMSRVPAACCTEPAVKNSPPLKKPWFRQCKQAGDDGQRRADAQAHHHIADLR